MNVSLTPELDRFVAEKVQSGFYSSVGEVIREGLRLLKQQDDLRFLRVEQLKREIAVGIEQLDKGEGRTFDSASALTEHIKAEGRRRNASSGRKKKG